ncbi:MBL fold metallo-hydrolase [Corynebacterium glyciniphilum]|uniref:MBL fold metallo-hydrolase n=1 Tax=Corynebacterium glyciniphilum TaxID=1404244 RepID=UPI00264F7D17|nr:MBL fold metallo-hydrolase [Corynebacterium glyciniphilum]MDN5684298.1 MBL fold metallo-hydrolase [Corynebacterium glyciniphilum]MDN6704713.1 MBL fold metallo-hydrolase [Corynebacterium glyciniphilum]
MANLTVEVLPTGPFEMNCLLLHDGADATVVDPGMGAGELIARAVEQKGLRITGIVLTHGHIDHVRDLPVVQAAYGVSSHMHPADNVFLQREVLDGMGPSGEAHDVATMETPEVPTPVEDGDVLTISGVEFVAHHMPGHSPGSVMFRGVVDGQGLILGGDVLFRGGVGRTDLPFSEPAAMVESLRRLVTTFEDDDTVVPGHGPTTTVGAEKEQNGFLQGVV